MLKKLLIFLVTVAIFTSCADCGNKSTDQTTEDKQEIAVITVDDYLTKIESLVGNEVSIEGTVNHVCKHGGEKMFIFSDNPEKDAKIVTGEEMASFNVALEGSDVIVTGIVEELRIDEAYLANWEAEIQAKTEEVAEEEHDHEGEEHNHSDQSEHGDKADMGEHKAETEKIQIYRDQLVNDSIDHISFYSIIATNVEEKAEAAE